MRLLFATFVLLFSTGSVLAQARILIESIEIQHPAGISDRILLSETRITEGSSYTEEEIRQAIYRIRRLPFVLRAEYRFEPGTTFEGRRLVIAVEPVKRFNMTLDLGYQRRSDFDVIILSPNAGYRAFLDNSAFEVGIGTTSFSDGGGDFRNLNFEYSGYDLFGTGTLVQLGLGYSVSRGDTRPDLSPTARIVFPLTQVQSIVATYTSLGEERDFALGIEEVPVTTSFEQRLAKLLWMWETTDDPLFTVRGTSISAGPTLVEFETRSPRLIGNPPEVSYIERNERQIGLEAVASRFFPIGERSTIRATLESFAVRVRSRSPVVDRTLDIAEAVALATVARNFGGTNRHRLEAGGAYRIRAERADDIDSTEGEPGFTVAYTYRHRRFFLRLSGIYY